MSIIMRKLMPPPIDKPPFHGYDLPIFLGASFLTVMIVSRVWTKRQAGKFAKEHMRHQHQETLTELLIAYRFGSTAEKSAVRNALCNSLQNIDQIDETEIGSPEVSLLLQLAKGEDIELALATLIALERCGDRQSLRVVQGLAQGKGIGARFPEIRDQAKITFASIQRRLGEATADETLLRSSEQPVDSNTLLRSSNVSEGVNESQILLRSTRSDMD